MADEISREEHWSAIFATMVMQLTNMTAMFLGQVPNPETNQKIVDLEAAQIFIDQLEMLEAKTKGNLSADEQNILKQGLTMVRMAYVEAAEASNKTAPTAGRADATPPPGAESGDADARKKFTKKY